MVTPNRPLPLPHSLHRYILNPLLPLSHPPYSLSLQVNPKSAQRHVSTFAFGPPRRSPVALCSVFDNGSRCHILLDLCRAFPSPGGRSPVVEVLLQRPRLLPQRFHQYLRRGDVCGMATGSRICAQGLCILLLSLYLSAHKFNMCFYCLCVCMRVCISVPHALLILCICTRFLSALIVFVGVCVCSQVLCILLLSLYGC